mgnify:CR=1 FL=1
MRLAVEPESNPTLLFARVTLVKLIVPEEIEEKKVSFDDDALTKVSKITLPLSEPPRAIPEAFALVVLIVFPLNVLFSAAVKSIPLE